MPWRRVLWVEGAQTQVEDRSAKLEVPRAEADCRCGEIPRPHPAANAAAGDGSTADHRAGCCAAALFLRSAGSSLFCLSLTHPPRTLKAPIALFCACSCMCRDICYYCHDAVLSSAVFADSRASLHVRVEGSFAATHGRQDSNAIYRRSSSPAHLLPQAGGMRSTRLSPPPKKPSKT